MTEFSLEALEQLLYEGEHIDDTYTGNHQAVVLTDQRLLVVASDHEIIDSVDFVDAHVLDVDLKTKSSYRTKHVVFGSFVLLVAGGGWASDLFGLDIALMLAVAAVGIVVWAGYEEKHILSITTEESSNTIPLPEGAATIAERARDRLTHSKR